MSAVLVMAGNGVPTVVTPPIQQGLEATGTATAGGTTLTTASAELPPPVPAVLPPKKPLVATTLPGPAKPRAQAKLAPFETCLPACETRDPQAAVAGSATPRTMPPQMVMVEQAPPQSPAVGPPAPFLPPALLESFQEPVPMPPRQSPVDLVVDTGQALVEQATDASNAVVQGTKRALDVAVDLVR